MSLSASTTESLVPQFSNYENFSQWRRMKSSTAYVLRAVELWKKTYSEENRSQIQAEFEFNKEHDKNLDEKERKIEKEKRLRLKISSVPALSVQELSQAEFKLFQEAQSLNPPDENTIRNLQLFQENEVWRAKGRLDESELGTEAKNPIYLPRDSPITKLIITELHKERKHAGMANLTCALRQRFWIPRVRQKINSVIRKNRDSRCHYCARIWAKAYPYPDPPALPKCRVSGEQLFETVGIDYFGPMTVKSSEGKKVKVYGAIFTCALSRAVHLELVTDATAEKFLLAFTRFIRRRRVPKRVISDNGRNFVLGNKALKELCQEEMREKQLWTELYQNSKVQEFSVHTGIEWMFISPYAPYRGGFYERLIGTVKYHLKREVRRRLLSFEELWTLLCEVERIVNERPLVYISESEVTQPLRPIDLLQPGISQEVDVIPPKIDLEDPEFFSRMTNKETVIGNYKKALYGANRFWEEWRGSYLTSLKERHKNCEKEGEKFPRVGDLVIVGDLETRRSLWPLGRVEELISSRTVKVKIGDKLMERSIKNLYPLEIENESVDNELEEANGEETTKNEKLDSPQLTYTCSLISVKTMDEVLRVEANNDDEGIVEPEVVQDEEPRNVGERSVVSSNSNPPPEEPPKGSENESGKNETAVMPVSDRPTGTVRR